VLAAMKERAGGKDKDCGDYRHCGNEMDGGREGRGDLLPVIGWML
jgi:hypothetical protein